MTDEELEAFLKLWRQDLRAMRNGTYKPPKIHPSRTGSDSGDHEGREMFVEERRKKILALRRDGVSVHQIACYVGLSVSRIYQILQAENMAIGNEVCDEIEGKRGS